jgi:hypothetical protein
VREIVRAVEEKNGSLVKMDIEVNDADNGRSGADGSLLRMANLSPALEWEGYEAALQRVLIRNENFKVVAPKQAVSLLFYARAILLEPSPDRVSSPLLTSFSRILHLSSLPTLPMELILLILSFLAPSLSSGQRFRIYRYASSLSTLPVLCDSQSPTTATSASASASLTESFWCKGRYCRNGPCCDKEENRDAFLDIVRCTMYESEVR